MNFDLTIGVTDLRISSTAPCSKTSSCHAQFSVSFGLRGDFSKAAQTDALSDTVDYDALCDLLCTQMRARDCSNVSAITQEALHMVRTFSPQIVAGTVLVKILCHAPFIVREALL